jgi:hypothetical protein
MPQTPQNFGGSDIFCNDVVVGVTEALASTGQPTGGGQNGAKYSVRSVNFNAAATDNILLLPLPTGAKNYTVSGVYITNASHTLTTATLGVFSAAGGTGTTIAADQAITVTNGTANTALNTQALTLSPAATIAFNYGSLYVRVGTAEGAAATADVTVILNYLG